MDFDQIKERFNKSNERTQNSLPVKMSSFLNLKHNIQKSKVRVNNLAKFNAHKHCHVIIRAKCNNIHLSIFGVERLKMALRETSSISRNSLISFPFFDVK